VFFACRSAVGAFGAGTDSRRGSQPVAVSRQQRSVPELGDASTGGVAPGVVRAGGPDGSDVTGPCVASKQSRSTSVTRPSPPCRRRPRSAGAPAVARTLGGGPADELVEGERGTSLRVAVMRNLSHRTPAESPSKRRLGWVVPRAAASRGAACPARRYPRSRSPTPNCLRPVTQTRAMTRPPVADDPPSRTRSGGTCGTLPIEDHLRCVSRCVIVSSGETAHCGSRFTPTTLREHRRAGWPAP
jgi:hypothetical protein